MDKKTLSFRCIAYQEKDKTFTGVCLDLDIVEEGHVTLQEAILSINDAITSHIHASALLGNSKELLERPAPEEYWQKLDELVHAGPKNPNFLHSSFIIHLNMPKYKPLKYRDILTILTHLGFQPKSTGSTSHQTWTLAREGKKYAVTIFFHGSNLEFRDGTLNSMIRQSGFTKEEFYQALKKVNK